MENDTESAFSYTTIQSIFAGKGVAWRCTICNDIKNAFEKNVELRMLGEGNKLNSNAAGQNVKSRIDITKDEKYEKYRDLSKFVETRKMFKAKVEEVRSKHREEDEKMQEFVNIFARAIIGELRTE
ncbi:hypothetical protein CHS0354_006478 [Potamilus streckersoni]|uniref:Uncharacterized protein n=1 Tax=Potamilus streckersoni TaxID=2493646 RepID=A0AAE0TAB5_9BIVA|nr:hypothetical protein CHS0354_006478 [Potamilus streckersoni]